VFDSAGVNPTLDDENGFDFTIEADVRDAWVAHHAGLRAFAARAVRDEDLAEDLVQETFLRAFRHASTFDRARGSSRTWLYAIMRNLLVDVVRQHARRPRTAELVDEWPATDEVDALLSSLTAGEAVQRLTADHQQVILHSYVAQRPTAEIAELLGIPVGTVRSRLFYARKALGDALSAVGAVASPLRDQRDA
jgi:RNA polymerase sigma-70 factor (ECF subfamily)